jgi:hypothetical protein
VDPQTSLALVALLEEWSQGEASDVLRLVFAIALAVGLVTLLPAWFVRGRQDRPSVSAPANEPSGPFPNVTPD